MTCFERGDTKAERIPYMLRLIGLKNHAKFHIKKFDIGGLGGYRTHMAFRPRHFKCRAYTIPPRALLFLPHHFLHSIFSVDPSSEHKQEVAQPVEIAHHLCWERKPCA